MLALVRLGRHNTKIAQDTMIAMVLAVILFRASTTITGTKSNIITRPAAAKRAKDPTTAAGNM
jgi:hypothetical protein